MQRDRHDAPRALALAVQDFALAANHALELLRRDVVIFDRYLVVDLGRIGNRAEAPSAAEIHDVGLVVVHPVGDIFAAELGEIVERMPRFLQPRAQPTGDFAPGGGAYPLERRAHHFALGAFGKLVQAAHVGLAVPHELPAEALRLLNDLGMRIADFAVQRYRAPYAVARHHFHEAPDADTVAVIAWRPCEHIGNQPARAAGALRHALIEREEFDVRNHPHGEPGAVGPDDLRPPRDRRIRERTVAARLHRRCATTSSTCITSAYL